ncbi:MAG: hypothetical protein KGR26_14860, partial [Cyanobacteria bacterium REEB65]|nr:hypothetical protein [Cyanobacteria bacterium REEB65]
SGDGGPATSAKLSEPGGMAFDAAGNLYIAEYGNNIIRKITASGIISTVVGTGTAGFAGDGGNPTSAELYSPADVAFDTSGHMFVDDYGNNVIREVY